jgi:type IV pilus assembly protein PilA
MNSEQESAPKKKKKSIIIPVVAGIFGFGLLSAIALPSFLGQANKARESQGRQIVTIMNRAQIRNYAETNHFGSTVQELSGQKDVGQLLPMSNGNTIENQDYKYTIVRSNDALVQTTASSKTGKLRGYIGFVWLYDYDKNSRTTSAKICKQIEAGTVQPEFPNVSFFGSELSCPKNYEEVTK